MAIDRALRIVDEIVADMCICDIQPTKAEKMCAAMEECFKRFLAQRRCEIGQDVEIIKFNEVDMLDELIKKCKFSEEELKISRPVIETAYQKFVDAYMSAHEVRQWDWVDNRGDYEGYNKTWKCKEGFYLVRSQNINIRIRRNYVENMTKT